MSRMVDDLLFLAKADNGLLVPQRQAVALEALVAKQFEYYQLLAEERGVTLSLQGRGRALGDASLLDRVVSNLLSNALRYTPPGEAVRVCLTQANGRARLQVENRGPSLAAQDLERLFDCFYRADPARREGGPGNAGLGLSIVRSIVRAHGGQVGCESAGGLTRFTVELPAA